MLEAKNGFVAFESALHVFGTCNVAGDYSIDEWNAQDLWRSHYGDLVDGCFFFAEDVFAMQFAMKDNVIWSFDAETGALTKMAESMEGWASALLADHAYLTGFPMAHSWQSANRPLALKERLFPKYPFVLGGKFELSNIVASNAARGMQFRGFLAQELRNLPDGTRVTLEFDPLQ